MKPKVITTIALLSLLALSVPVYAKESENRGRVAEVVKASTTERRIEKQQNVTKRKAEQAGKVLLATIERLEKIVLRLDSRIAKVKAAGGLTAESERYSAEAKFHLAEARKSLGAFKSVDLSGLKASENFSRVRDVASVTREHIRQAHQSLTKAIRALKPGRSNSNATSTGATTTNAASTVQ